VNDAFYDLVPFSAVEIRDKEMNDTSVQQNIAQKWKVIKGSHNL
jgi:hypothetical protein